MKKRVLWIIIAIVALLVGGGLWFLLSKGVGPAGFVKVAASGGDRLLRDPMRPAAEGSRVLLIALDGVGYDELARAVRSGQMPHLARVLGQPAGDDFEHGILLRTLSILPSTTMAAWTSIYTGEPPARTGIPGNEWFVREEGRFFAPAPVTIDEFTHTVEMLTEDLMGRALRVPTLYERLDRRAFVALAPIYRGADLFVFPAPEAVGGVFLETAQGITSGESVSREAYSEMDEETVENLAESIERHGIADLQVIYLAGTDLFAHVTEDPTAKTREYLGDVTDPAIRGLLRLYREAGIDERTYVVVVSDHGHTPVLEDDRHALGATGSDEPAALLEHVGFRVRPPKLELADEEGDYQAVLAYQGAMAYVHLADRSTCPDAGMPCDWRLPPRLEEDVMPVARAFFEASRTGAGVPQLHGALDLVFAREPRGYQEDARPFQVFDGDSLVPLPTYLERNPRPDLIRLEERMNWLSAGPYGHRSGDVLLLAMSGQERPIEQRYYFSNEYRSWHGSPSAQDSYVPLLIAHLGQSGRELRSRLRLDAGAELSQLDVVPLLCRLMESEGCDGMADSTRR